MENVWEMGGLGILTSVPITPRVVCFLCASSGHVEVNHLVLLLILECLQAPKYSAIVYAFPFL